MKTTTIAIAVSGYALRDFFKDVLTIENEDRWRESSRNLKRIVHLASEHLRCVWVTPEFMVRVERLYRRREELVSTKFRFHNLSLNMFQNASSLSQSEGDFSAALMDIIVGPNINKFSDEQLWYLESSTDAISKSYKDPTVYMLVHESDRLLIETIKQSRIATPLTANNTGGIKTIHDLPLRKKARQKND